MTYHTDNCTVDGSKNVSQENKVGSPEIITK